MSRDAPAELIAGFQQPVVRPFLAAELDYPAGPVRLTTLDRDKTVMINGETFHGAGMLGQISALEDGAESRSYGFTLSLSGIPGDWGAYLRGQDVQGRRVRIWLGLADAAWRPVATQLVKVGRMDAQDVQTAEQTAVVVTCEDVMVDWERPRVRRCTDVDHQTRHPGDGFFKYVAALQNIILHEPR
jgi:hypothetical protein